MSDTTNEEIARRLQQVFVNPDVAAKVVEAIVPSNKPKGWSHKASAPYFKEIYGQQMKDIFDALIANPNQDFMYDYKTYAQYGLSSTTTYLRVNQSIRYLLEKMDPDGKYQKFYHEKILIKKERNVGVRICVLPEFRVQTVAEHLAARAVIPKFEGPAWRKKMEDWLEKAQPGDKPFVQEGLALTPEEIQELKDTFIGVRGFICNITSFSIKIVPINEDAI